MERWIVSRYTDIKLRPQPLMMISTAIVGIVILGLTVGWWLALVFAIVSVAVMGVVARGNQKRRQG